VISIESAENTTFVGREQLAKIIIPMSVALIQLLLFMTKQRDANPRLSILGLTNVAPKTDE